MCRDPDSLMRDEAQEPQSAVTVTETFPDGTSEPESEVIQAAEGHPGASHIYQDSLVAPWQELQKWIWQSYVASSQSSFLYVCTV